jgi:hypothetical protein
VQAEIYGVDRQRRLQVLQEDREDLLECPIAYLGGRRGARPNGGEDLVASGKRQLDEARHRQVLPANRRRKIRTARHVGIRGGMKKVVEGRLAWREGVGLVMKSTDRDPRHGI